MHPRWFTSETVKLKDVRGLKCRRKSWIYKQCFWQICLSRNSSISSKKKREKRSFLHIVHYAFLQTGINEKWMFLYISITGRHVVSTRAPACIYEQTGRPARARLDRAEPSLARRATVPGCPGLRAWPTAQAWPMGLFSCRAGPNGPTKMACRAGLNSP